MLQACSNSPAIGFQWICLPGGNDLSAALGDVFGLGYVLPARQGRAAENLPARVLVKAGSVIPMNYRFTTTKEHPELAGDRILELFRDEARNTRSSEPFKGNMDLERLEAAIAEHGAENIPFVSMETATSLIAQNAFLLHRSSLECPAGAC